MTTIGDFQVHIGADDTEFRAKMKGVSESFFDLQTHAKKMVGGLAALGNAFGTVGGSVGKTMSVVGSLAQGLAAGGPVGLAVASIATAVGFWAEETKRADDEAKKLTKTTDDLKTSIDRLNVGLSLGMTATQKAISNVLIDQREEIKNNESLNTLIARRKELSEDWMWDPNKVRAELIDVEGKIRALTNQISAKHTLRIETLWKENGNWVEFPHKTNDFIADMMRQRDSQNSSDDSKAKAWATANPTHIWLKGFRALGPVVSGFNTEMDDTIRIESDALEVSKKRLGVLEQMKKTAAETKRLYEFDRGNKATLTQTGTVPFADQSGRDNIKGMITGMLGNIVPVFDTFFKGGATKLIGTLSTSLAGVATSIGTAIAGLFSSPAVLAIIAVAAQALALASIPVVIAQYLTLFHEIATIPLIPFKLLAMAALGAATGLGALYLAAVGNTESFKRAQASFTRMQDNFTYGAEGLFDAINPVIYIAEVFTKHMGRAVNSIMHFTPASKFAFEAIKGLAVMFLQANIAVMTAFDTFIDGIGYVVNMMIDNVNVLRMAMGKDLIPNVVAGGISGSVLGQSEALLAELVGLTWEEAAAAMDDNTDATRENTRAMERLSNVPSGYRMRSTIWQSQQPIVATPLPAQGSVSGSLGGGLGGMSFADLYGI